jgi:hypothetical protein
MPAEDPMGAKETEGALRRTLGVALSVASLLLCGFYVWLKIARGVSYVGPVPTPALWTLPAIAACWLGIWPQRRKARWQVRVMALATALLLAALIGLFIVR